MREIRKSRSLGGKISTNTASPFILAEIISHKKFIKELQSLGCVNSNNQSKLFRQTLLKFANKENKNRLEKLFVELKLEF